MSKSSVVYRCVKCFGESLHKTDDVGFLCQTCHTTFPVIQTIPVFTWDPEASLRAYRGGLLAEYANAANLNRYVSCHRDDQMTSRLRNAHKALDGMCQNAFLIARYAGPIAAYVATLGSPPSSCVSWAARDGYGWASDAMLPYFYQDWGGTPEFSAVRTLILGALLKYCSDTEGVAVLGAGAGGLAYALASRFGNLHAVDLSLPTLLMTQGVLNGDEIEPCLQRAGWKRLRLRRDGPRLTNIHLAAADASLLPLATRSVSAVVTQYLMDIVPHPMAIVSEIRRVLKTDGIWINFSLPMRLAEDVPGLSRLDVSDVPTILRDHGFETLEINEKVFKLLDMTTLDDKAPNNTQRPQFFAARVVDQTVDGSLPFPYEPLSDDWWFKRPKLNALVKVGLTRTENLWPTQAERSYELRINSKRFALTSDQSRCLAEFFANIDGTKTLAEIFRELLAYGVSIDEKSFHHLINVLQWRYNALATTGSAQTHLLPSSAHA